MSTMNGVLSARQRKSLADQIDRLDGVLDGLADALNGAVADAVREAVGAAVTEAVQAVLREVLTNPQLTQAMTDAHRPVAAPAEPKPAPTRLATAAKRVLSAVTVAGGWVVSRAKGAIRFTGQTTAAAVSKAGTCVRDARTAVSVVAAFAGLTRRRVLVAAGIGVSVAVGCYLAGPVVASAACGLASAASVAAGLVRTLWPVPGWPTEAQDAPYPLD